MATFELFFTDLTPEAQEQLMKCAGIVSIKEANWDVFPIDVIEFEDDDQEAADD